MAPDLEGYGRDALAVLVREYLLAGHLIDRAGMPHVIGGFGADAMRDVAIDEWMGASPIYTRRMQQLLGYTGDTVETMFKGIQFDIGSPPQFMDFRFKVEGPNYGEFWLASCGALLDVEPMGEDFVVAMCHHIEDPTFDATASAVNPRARVRPIHRPPRVPSDRHPHCHWKVVIDPEVEAVEEPAMAVRIGATLAAASAVALTVASPDTPVSEVSEEPEESEEETGLLGDYRGPLVGDLRLEDFRRDVLIAIADEVCLQGHLLAMSFAAALEDRFGLDAAKTLGRKQFIGIAGLTADRLRRALGLGRDLEAIATVLELHPAFRPRSYVNAAVERTSVAGTDALLFMVRPCPAQSEPREHPWPKLLQRDDVAALEAIAQAVDPRARCAPADPPDGAGLAWTIVIGSEPAKEAPEVALTRFSTGADFVFVDRR
jgi:hypothetical protein